MHAPAIESISLPAGTSGWSINDLENPQIERAWEQGCFEIIEGVLSQMPAAYFDSGQAISTLAYFFRRWIDESKNGARVSTEVDLVLSDTRVPKVDLMYLTAEQQSEQMKRSRQRGKPGVRFGRIVVPPMLVVESISLGHEFHDRELKRRWYEEVGIANYWMLNVYERTLECLVLENAKYRVDQAGKEDAELHPSSFPGLILPLAKLWA